MQQSNSPNQGALSLKEVRNLTYEPAKKAVSFLLHVHQF